MSKVNQLLQNFVDFRLLSPKNETIFLKKFFMYFFNPISDNIFSKSCQLLCDHLEFLLYLIYFTLIYIDICIYINIIYTNL